MTYRKKMHVSIKNGSYNRYFNIYAAYYITSAPATLLAKGFLCASDIVIKLQTFFKILKDFKT